jgi:hypothetical protein
MILSRVILLFAMIDTIIWIFTIMTGAANMLAGSSYEARLDYRIIKLAPTLVELLEEVIFRKLNT